MNLEEKKLKEIIDDLLVKFEGLIDDSSGPQKTIFDIAGISTRENINSNIMQFFLLKNEEHGFGSIFFDSLCELIQEQKPEINLALDSDYEVIREYQNIDILIASKSSGEGQRSNVFDWAIIIEHKIYHKLDNDLLDYWNRVKVKKGGTKIGIVLSPYGQEDQSLLRIEKEQEDKTRKYITTYLDLNHREWMEKVRKKLPDYFLHGNNYSLNLLKDFLNNIESMYMSRDERERLETQINVLQDNLSEVNKIMKLEQEARKYILSESIKVMKTLEFEAQNEYYSSTGKYFSPVKKDKKNKEEGNDDDKKVMPKYFKFYFWYPAFIEGHELNLHFFLDDEYVQYAEELRKDETVIAAVNKLHYGIIDKNKPNHLIHIKEGSFKDFGANHTFYNHLYNRMDDTFFKKETGLIWICKDALDKIIKNKNGNN